MKCSSCEVLIERGLKAVQGVSQVKVSRAREEAEITCSEQVQLDDLQKALRGQGYALSPKSPSGELSSKEPPSSGKPPQEPSASGNPPAKASPSNQPKGGIAGFFRRFRFSRNTRTLEYGKPGESGPNAGKRRYAEIGAIFLFIMAGYLILRQFGLLPRGLGITDNMSYGFIFLIGLVAATSTCLAVAGGLLLAVAARHNERNPGLSGWQRFRPHIYFNIGRVISYTLLGGVIGLLGSMLTFSPKVTGLLTLAASLLMILIGIQLLQVFPWANRINFRMPKFIAHKLYDAGSSGSKTPALLFGAATFFLPCGFTQALQLYVLGQGDFASGALTMLAFSLGTLPSLAGIGAFSSFAFAKGRLQRHFMTFSAVLVIILGIFNIPNGMALAGVGMPLGGAGLNFGGTGAGALLSGASVTGGGAETIGAIDENVKLVDGKQVVDMQVVGLDYYPHKFKVLQGVPVEWRIDGSRAEGCAQVISVPKLGLTEFIPRQGIKTIEFLPQEVGVIPFSCTMGMTTYGAAFEVVENPAGVKAAALAGNPEGAAGTGEGAEGDGDQNGAAAPGGLGETGSECNPEVMNCNLQKIFMEVSREKGFYPRTHVVKKGIPVEMEVDTKLRLGGCMSTMVIPEYGVAHLLEMGKTTLRFTPEKAGTFPFTCSMGSKQGEFIVI